jgi:hypothetical protein
MLFYLPVDIPTLALDISDDPYNDLRMNTAE